MPLQTVPLATVADATVGLGVIINGSSLRSARPLVTSTLPDRTLLRRGHGPLADYLYAAIDGGSGGASFTIGRTARADLVIADSRISSLHARVEVDGAGLWLMDLNSTNGTLVDGALLQPGLAGRKRLALSQEFIIGDTPMLVVDAGGLQAFVRRLR